jgi:hypothetical protein
MLLTDHRQENRATFGCFPSDRNRLKPRLSTSSLRHTGPQCLQGNDTYEATAKALSHCLHSFVRRLRNEAIRYSLRPQTHPPKTEWRSDHIAPLARWSSMLAVFGGTEHCILGRRTCLCSLHLQPPLPFRNQCSTVHGVDRPTS